MSLDAATPAPASPDQARLEQALSQVEAPLESLQHALMHGDVPAIDTASRQLQAQLARAVDTFMRAGHRQPIPAALRQRLGAAGARIHALRQTLARLQAARAQALDLLLPAQGAGQNLYSARGTRASQGSSGLAQA